MASLERDFLLLGVFEFVSLVERGPVAVAVSVSTCHNFHAWDCLLVNTKSKRRRHPSRPLHRPIAILDIVPDR